MPRRRLRRGSPSQLPPLLVVLLHPLRLENLREHRFDLPSATEPHLKFEQARVLGFEAAEHLGGGCDLVGLRSEPAFVGRSSDSKRTEPLGSKAFAEGPTFGTRGSQVQILPLRPTVSKTYSYVGQV